jgi:hypothetical protein
VQKGRANPEFADYDVPVGRLVGWDLIGIWIGWTSPALLCSQPPPIDVPTARAGALVNTVHMFDGYTRLHPFISQEKKKLKQMGAKRSESSQLVPKSMWPAHLGFFSLHRTFFLRYFGKLYFSSHRYYIVLLRLISFSSPSRHFFLT